MAKSATAGCGGGGGGAGGGWQLDSGQRVTRDCGMSRHGRGGEEMRSFQIKPVEMRKNTKKCRETGVRVRFLTPPSRRPDRERQREEQQW